ncbi:MAG: hypothetical protein AAFW73_02825 [Bacteroidota bacterium]
MKLKFLYLLCLISLFSCGKEQLEPVEQSLELTATEREHLCEMGYDQVDEVLEEYVRVEGDVLVYRPALHQPSFIDRPAWYDAGKEAIDRQLTLKQVDQVIAYDNLTIKAYVEGFSASFLPEIVLAARVWNSQFRCQVRFELTREPLGADMTIRNSTNITFGQACAPFNGQVGNLIELNEFGLLNTPVFFTSPNCGPITRTFNIQERVNVIIHEMGHSLGFFHADANAHTVTGTDACGTTFSGDGFFLHGTTANDITSVMTSGPIQFSTGDCTINGINAADLRAAQMLYPDPDPIDIPDIASLTTVSGNLRRVTIAYPANPAYYQLEICVQPSGGPLRCFRTIADQNSYDFLSPPGFTLVRVSGLNYRGDFQTNFVQDGVVFP